MVGASRRIGWTAIDLRRGSSLGSTNVSWRRVAFSFVMVCVGMVAVASSLLGMVGPGREPLTVMTASGRHAFWVEVARSAAKQQQGLMFRTSLPADHGMLFLFEAEAPIRMWMKNTYIPLDMIFISSKGKVISVHENAKPRSESVISSGEPARGVLEVYAGTAERIGIEKGSLIRHPAFVD